MVGLALLLLVSSSFPRATSSKLFDQKVTIDIPGWTVKKTLETLSQKTGLKFVASDEIGNDHVIIHVKDVTVAEFMKHLANVEYGQWFKNRGQYDFQLDHKKYQAWADQCTADFAKKIRESIAKRVKKSPIGFQAEGLAVRLKDDMNRASNGRTLDQAQAALNALQKESDLLPIAYALTEILPNLPIDKIATLQRYQRIVFSNHPTAMQYALPDSCNPVLTELQKNQDAFLNVTSGLGLDSVSSLTIPNLTIPNKSIDSDYTFNIAFKGDFGLLFEVSMFVFDPKGNLVGRTYTTLGLNFGPAPTNKLDPTDEIPVPERAHQFETLFSNAPTGITTDSAGGTIESGINGPKFQELITPEVRKELLNPEIYDPLSLVSYPLLAAYAKAENINIITSGDAIEDLINGDPKQTKFSLQSFKRPPESLFLKVLQSDNWIEISDATPGDEPLFHLDRSSLGELLRNGIEDGVVSPIAFAKFASLNPSDSFEDGIKVDYTSVLSTDSKVVTQEKISWLQMQLIGSLDPREISMAQSQGLRASELNPTQVALLTGAVFDSFKESNMFSSAPIGVSILNEPTFAFADGIPPDARISVIEKPTETFSISFIPSVNSQRQELPLKDLASIITSKPSIYDLSSIGLNEERVLTYSLEFPGVRGIYNESNSWVEKKIEQKVKDWHDLPASIVKQIQDAIDNSPKGN